MLFIPGSVASFDRLLNTNSLGDFQQTLVYPLDSKYPKIAEEGKVEDGEEKDHDSNYKNSLNTANNYLEDNGIFWRDELANNFIDQIQIRVTNESIENSETQSSEVSFNLADTSGLEVSSEYNIIGEFEIEGSRTIEQKVVLKNENKEPVTADLELVYDLSDLEKIVYDGKEYSTQNPPQIKSYITQEEREVCLYDEDPSESNLRILSGFDCLAGSYSITSQVTEGASVSLFDNDSNELRIDFSQNQNIDAYFRDSSLVLDIHDFQVSNNTYKTAVSVVYTMDEVYGNYNLRIDGAEASDALAFPQLEFADIDGNGKPDLLVSGYWVSPTNSYGTYIISDKILSDQIGKGAAIDLSDSNNYSLRIDGTYYIRPLDIDNDGIDEFVFNDYLADTLTRTNNGTVVIYQPGFVDLSTPGQTANVATLTTTYPNYYAIIHGARNGDGLGYGNGEYRSFILDYDGDELFDYAVVSPFADDDGSNTGSVYIFNGLLLKNTTPGQSFDLLNEDYSVRISGELDNQPNTGISAIRKIDA
ncbi:hypothetical protein KC909_06405, partial [Candidatus Dojkabacteria bacterium]|nr:hypothetical protein [Candidatus Dojkabacteria bacterium]